MADEQQDGSKGRGLKRTLPWYVGVFVLLAVGLVILGFLQIIQTPGGCSVTRKEHWGLAHTWVKVESGD